MTKIHKEKSRSEYFTFKVLSGGDRKEKSLWVQETKVARMRVMKRRVNKFIKLTSIKARESYNLFRPNNSLKTVGYDILNVVTGPAYKICKML